MTQDIPYNRVVMSVKTKPLRSDTKVAAAIQYTAQYSIYSKETALTELTTAQTAMLSLMYALTHGDLQMFGNLLDVVSSVPQISSSFLGVWLKDDFRFLRGDVARSLSSLGRLIHEGHKVPWCVVVSLASLVDKYQINDCFIEADDKPGQLLLTTMSTLISKDTQSDKINPVLPKETQRLTTKRVSFQKTNDQVSTGTQAGPIVYDRGVSVKPEPMTSCSAQTTTENLVSTGTQAVPILYDRAVSVRPEPMTSCSVQTTTEGLISKETQTPSLSNVSVKTISQVTTGTQAGPIVYDRAVNVRPEPMTSCSVQTTTEDRGAHCKKENTISCASTKVVGADKNSIAGAASILSQTISKKEFKKEIGYQNLSTRTSLSSWNDEKVFFEVEWATETMFTAIEKNDPEAIKVAVNAGAGVNVEGIDHKKPLLAAASAGSLEAAVELIHWGADVDCRGKWMETPLLVAAEAGHFRMVEMFIAAGADISRRNSEGNFALHYAANVGHDGIVRLLLDSGADVDSRGSYNWTPLHHAANQGHLSVVQLLLSRGANCRAADTGGETPLQRAINSRHHAVINFLQSWIGPSPRQIYNH